MYFKLALFQVRCGYEVKMNVFFFIYILSESPSLTFDSPSSISTLAKPSKQYSALLK